MFEKPRRSLRIKSKNMEIIFKKEKELMNRKESELRISLATETTEFFSQKLQNFRADVDTMNYKHSRLRESVALCVRTHILAEEKFIEEVCESREPHFERYFHLHSDYCTIWFRAYGKWGCLEPIDQTGGYFDKNIQRCGFKHEDLDS